MVETTQTSHTVLIDRLRENTLLMKTNIVIVILDKGQTQKKSRCMTK